MSKNPQRSPHATWGKRIVEAIGNWNPQLLHELNSRVSWLNVAICGLLSIGLQIATMAGLASWMNAGIDRSQSYSKGDHIENLTQWPPLLWGCFAGMISYIILLLMATVAVYFIASSFHEEEQQGTLDFLRLAPHGSATILVGKLLGVPALVYVAGVCALPLQLYAAQAAQISLLTVLTWDVEIVGMVAIFGLSAALVTLRLNWSPILLAISTLGLAALLTIVSFMSQIDSSASVQWYGISLQDPLVNLVGIAAMAGMGIYWQYQALARIYDRMATSLSRLQSYLWSLNCHLLLLGFCITTGTDRHSGIFNLAFDLSLQTYRSQNSVHPIYGDLPGLFWSFLAFWLLSLIPLLRSTDRVLTSQTDQKFTKSSWLQTILFDDRAPAIWAVLANLGIALFGWSLPALARLPTIEISDDFGAYSVSSFGINFPFWLAIIFVLMFSLNAMMSSNLFRRVCTSPLWIALSIVAVSHPTIVWTFFRQ
jgi:hypothetical protein